jgi:hypothetical protein
MFVGFGWLAIYLFLNEHEGWAVIPGLMAVAGIVAAIRGRQGTCPGCGTRVHFEHRHGASACSMCGRYSRLEEGRVKFVEPGFIAMSPSFKVPFDAFLDRPDTLRHRWPWHWPRPGRCCVCGALATRSKGYVITLKAGVSARGLVVRECRLAIPHCGKCSDGIVPKGGEELRFRSFDYWREFCDLNELSLVRE